MPVTCSPLRYPGGKSQLYSFVRELIKLNIGKDGTYIEPFAGGAGVALQLLINGDVKNIVINDLDNSIHSLWYSLLFHTEELLNLIDKTPINVDEWYKQKIIYKTESIDPFSLKGGFATLFLNRTNVSGIISGGPIGGFNQGGKYKIDCRFNKSQLIKKIEIISSLRDHISISNIDAELLVREIPLNFSRESTFIFIDPPYFSQGKNLYLKFIDNDKHQNLKNSIDQIDNYKWILTYDKSDVINDIYADLVQKFQYQLRYSANNMRKERAWEYLFASSTTKLKNFEKIVLKKIGC